MHLYFWHAMTVIHVRKSRAKFWPLIWLVRGHLIRLKLVSEAINRFRNPDFENFIINKWVISYDSYKLKHVLNDLYWPRLWKLRASKLMLYWTLKKGKSIWSNARVLFEIVAKAQFCVKSIAYCFCWLNLKNPYHQILFSITLPHKQY